MSETLVLCYHAVTVSDWSAAVAVTARRFAAQMELLHRLGYRGVTFSEAATETGQGKRVAVTFDDAFRSVLENALPVLERYGWPGTVFVVADYGDGTRLLDWPTLDTWVGTPYEAELRAISWQDLAGLRDRGWEIGSHTCSHPHLTEIGADQLERELAESHRVCVDRLGACRSIAYPYGDVNQAVVEATRRAGYDAAAGLPEQLHGERGLEWPRVGIYYRDSLPRFAVKSLPLPRRLRTRRD